MRLWIPIVIVLLACGCQPDPDNSGLPDNIQAVTEPQLPAGARAASAVAAELEEQGITSTLAEEDVNPDYTGSVEVVGGVEPLTLIGIMVYHPQDLKRVVPFLSNEADWMFYKVLTFRNGARMFQFVRTGPGGHLTPPESRVFRGEE
ncbi:MAG: hypothetical protein ACYTAF_09755 [Planctomycetota bacterium]